MKTLKNMIDEAFDATTIKNLETWITQRNQNQQKTAETDKQYFDILAKEIALQKAELVKKSQQPVQQNTQQPVRTAQLNSNTSTGTAQLSAN